MSWESCRYICGRRAEQGRSKPKPVPEASATVEIGRVIHQDHRRARSSPRALK